MAGMRILSAELSWEPVGQACLATFRWFLMGSWFPLGKQSPPLLTEGCDPPSGKKPHPAQAVSPVSSTRWALHKHLNRGAQAPVPLYSPACILQPQGCSSFHAGPPETTPNLPPRTQRCTKELYLPNQDYIHRLCWFINNNQGKPVF